MIYPIGYLFCERCVARQRFIVIAESSASIDPFGCECEVCGYTFGDRGYVIVDEFVNGKRVATTRPVLDERVLGLARAEYQAEYERWLLEQGSAKERLAAQAQLDAALDDSDLSKRRALIARPGMDPALAQRVLSPTTPKKP